MVNANNKNNIAPNDRDKYKVNISFNELEEVMDNILKAIDILTPYVFDSTPISQAVKRDGITQTYFIKKLIKDLKKGIL
jgi:hypothetical protein